jgi:ribonuclease HI
MIQLFCDGGVIGPNPSKLGITWAWCLVIDDKLSQWDHGFITPADVDQSPLTNNFSELYAAVRALESIPVKFRKRATLFTDSQITLYRMTTSHKFNGIPDWLRKRALKVRGVPVQLLAGHPTIAELKQGFANRNGNPVSKWNVFCDAKCGEAAKAFRKLSRKNDNRKNGGTRR